MALDCGGTVSCDTMIPQDKRQNTPEGIGGRSLEELALGPWEKCPSPNQRRILACCSRLPVLRRTNSDSLRGRWFVGYKKNICVRARVGACIAFKAFAANDEEDAGHLIENGHATDAISFCECHIPTTCKSTSARPVRLKYSSLMAAAGAATTRGAL
jgi:hypothetical protein